MNLKILYIICIRDLKVKSKFNEYVLCSTTNCEAANRIVDTLSICLKKDFEIFYQREYIEC